MRVTGERALTERALKTRVQCAQGLPTFAEADRKWRRQISREEWVGFSGERSAGATESSGGIDADEYDVWRTRGTQHMQQ